MRTTTIVILIGLAGCGGNNNTPLDFSFKFDFGSPDLAGKDMTPGGCGGATLVSRNWTLTAEYTAHQMCILAAQLANFDLHTTVTAPFSLDAGTNIVSGAAATGPTPEIMNLSCCPSQITCDTPSADAATLSAIVGSYDPCSDTLSITMLGGTYVDYPNFMMHSVAGDQMHAQTVEQWQYYVSAVGTLQFPSPHDGQQVGQVGMTSFGSAGQVFTLHSM